MAVKNTIHIYKYINTEKENRKIYSTM